MAQRGDRSNGVLIQKDHDGTMAKVIHRTEDSDMIRLGNNMKGIFITSPLGFHFKIGRSFI